MDDTLRSLAWQAGKIIIAIMLLGMLLKIVALLAKRKLRDLVFDIRNFRLISKSRSRQDLMEMTPTQFEHLCRMLFQNQGYKVLVTRPANDQGIDLSASKGDYRITAQCKRYTRHSVGRPDLQQFYGTFEAERADHGYFLTTSKFTQPAIDFARRKPITLIDGRELACWINRYASGHLEEEEPAQESEYKGVCASCGKETVLPFKPTTGKPVYCRECYLKRRRR